MGALLLPLYLLVSLLPLAGLVVNYTVAGVYFGFMAGALGGLALWLCFPIFLAFNVIHLGVVCPCYLVFRLAENADQVTLLWPLSVISAACDKRLHSNIRDLRIRAGPACSGGA